MTSQRKLGKGYEVSIALILLNGGVSHSIPGARSALVSAGVIRVQPGEELPRVAVRVLTASGMLWCAVI